MRLDILLEYFPILIQGCVNTIKLTAISIVIGIVLALIIVLLKISKIKPLEIIGTFYTWFFRGIPLLVLLFIIYFGLPEVGLELSSFQAAVVGLSINISAYIAEAIRGAILSVKKDQWEVSQTEGLTFIQTVFYIIIPQCFDRMLPTLANEFIALLKDTALVSTIAMTDLMSNAQRMANVSVRPLEIFFMASLMYLVMTSFFTSLFKVVEARVAVE